MESRLGGTAETARLLRAALDAAVEGRDARSAVATILRAVVEGKPWALAQAWLPSVDLRVLRRAGVEGEVEGSAARLVAESADLALEPGTDLPGRAWRSGEPVKADPTGAGGPRAPALRASGFRVVFAIPLSTGESTVAVLEVFSREATADARGLEACAPDFARAIDRAGRAALVRESELTFRRIVEHSTNMFYVHTPDHVLTYVSPQSRAFIDCDPEEALVRWTEFVTDNPANSIGMVRTEAAIRTGTRQPVYELELRTKRGRRIWVEVHEAPVVRDGTTVAIVGALTDVTDRKRAVEDTTRALGALQATLESTTDGILVLDRRGVVEHHNRKLSDMWGLPQDALEPGAGLEAFATALAALRDPAAFIHRMHDVAAHEDSESYDVLELRDGRTFETYSKPKLIGAAYAGRVWSFRDVTKRRLQAEALNAQSKLYETLLTAQSDLGDGCLIAEGGRIVYANDAYLALVGASKTDLASVPAFDLLATAEDSKPADPRAAAGRRETAIATADGRVVPVEASIKLLSSEPRRVLAIVRDISERKAAEEAIRSSEAQLAAAQQLGRFGSWEWQIAPNAVEWSAEMFRIFGLAPGSVDVTYEGFLGRLHPEDRSRVDGIVREAFATAKPFVFYHRIVRPDGAVRTIHARGEVVVDAEGRPVAMRGTGQDVTEQREAEEEIQRQKDLYETLTKAQSDLGEGVLITTRAGTFVYANDAYCALTGFTRSELAALASFWQLCPEDERAGLERRLAKSLREDRRGDLVETALLRKDGSRVEIEVAIKLLTGEPDYRMLSIVRDITERKRGEAELRRQKDFAEAILRSQSNLGTGVVITREGRLAYANDAFAGMLQTSVADLVGRDLFSLVPQEDRALLEARSHARASGGPPVPHYESVFLRGDGVRVRVEVSEEPLADGAGVLAIVRDVTERRESERRLRQAEKMAAVGQLVAGIAHDINNPLAVVRSNEGVIQECARLAASSIEADRTAATTALGDVERLSGTNLRALRRIESIVRRLAILAAPQAPRHVSTDLRPKIEESVELARAQFGHRLKIDLALPQLPDVKCDGDLLAHALYNLVVNGAEASPEAGTVRVAARLAEDGSLVLTVEDDGPGFPPGTVQGLFEPFATTKPHGNIGLGLTMSRSIVQDHGGTLTAETRREGGALVTIRIPKEKLA